MTLNFTSYSAFPASIRSDDDAGAMIWERGAENCGGNSRCLDWETSDSYESGGKRDWIDPVDLLPADPFGMEVRSNLAAAIFGWFEDFGASSSGSNDYPLNSGPESASGGCVGNGSQGFSDKGVQRMFGLNVTIGGKETSSSREPEQGLPHEGMILSLHALGVQDLLSVERVCRSFQYAVRSDPLLWRCIHIDSPLNEKLTDDSLLSLSQRAQGSLRCLSLVQCPKITDDGLRRVLESNPMLEKLSVSECLGLSMDGLINNLRAFKSSNVTGIKHLKLGRLFSVSPEQYDELQMLLSADMRRQQQKFSKPRFYHFGVSSIACEDDRTIDIEMCPRCQKFKLVFDCPLESCRVKGPGHCRACHVCIWRCKGCGRCVNDCRFVENFLLDYSCSGCWKQPQNREGSEEK